MRIIVKLLLGAVALVLIAVAAFWFLAPTERILRLAADQVRAATGRELTIAGAARPTLWPDLGAEVEGVALSNAEWAEGADMLTAARAQVSVALWPLLSGDVQVTGLRLIDPSVSLEIDADGRRNWDMSGGAATDAATGAAPAQAEAARAFGIDRAVISGGTVKFVDARSGRDMTLSELDADLSLPSMNAPMHLEGTARWNGKPAAITLDLDTPGGALAGREAKAALTLTIAEASVTWNGALAAGDAPMLRGALDVSAGAPATLIRDLGLGDEARALIPRLAMLAGLTVSGDVDLGAAAMTATLIVEAAVTGIDMRATGKLAGGDDWLAGGPIDLDATVTEGDATGRFKGVMGGKTLFDGQVDISGAPRRFAGFLGAAEALAGLPDAQLQTASLSGGLRLTPTGGRLSDARIVVDDLEGTLSGDYDLTGARPAAHATLTLGAVDLRPWLGEGRGAAASGDGAKGWSRTPIDISGFGGADVDLAVSAGPLTMRRGQIDRLEAALRVKDAGATLTVTRADMFGGHVSGTARAAPVQGGIRMSGAVKADGIDLGQALKAVADADFLDGTGAVDADFDAAGPHMDALMHSLSGAGSIDLSDGAINGIDFAVLVRNVLTGATKDSAKTEFTRFGGTWTIAKGVLTNKDLILTGPLITLTGAGRVGIGARDIDYRVTPRKVAPIEGLLAATGVKGLLFPVNVRGPWSGPSFTPDLARAIPGLLGAPAAAAAGGLGTIESVIEGVLGGGGSPPAEGEDPAAPTPAAPLDALKGLLNPFK